MGIGGELSKVVRISTKQQCGDQHHDHEGDKGPSGDG